MIDSLLGKRQRNLVKNYLRSQVGQSIPDQGSFSSPFWCSLWSLQFDIASSNFDIEISGFRTQTSLHMVCMTKITFKIYFENDQNLVFPFGKEKKPVEIGYETVQYSIPNID